MASEVKALQLGGASAEAEIDGAWFGGHVRPENRKEDRRDRRLKENQSGKRRCVVVIRERAAAGTGAGRSAARAFASEDASLAFIRSRVDRGTVLHADESPAWNALHARFAMRRVDHGAAYRGADGACTNQAESFFSRMRRAEIGHHHHFAGPYLHRYAQEMAWREDHRRDDNGAQVRRVVTLVTRNGPSVDFCGYWQRSRRRA